MNKLRMYRHYIGSVLESKEFLKSFYYHSLIDLNLIKLESILKYGILSKDEIEKEGIISLYTHQRNDFDSKNGSTFVSVSRLLDDITFSSMFESFTMHTLSSISLMIDAKSVRASSYGESESFFDDELFIKDRVEKENIKGILIPTHLTNERISNIPLLPNDLSCYTKTYINNLLSLMEIYFEKEIDRERILRSLEHVWELFSRYERPENMLSNVCETQREIYGMDIKDELALLLSNLYQTKYGLINPTVLDIINQINDNVSVYELTYKSVKRIK